MKDKIALVTGGTSGIGRGIVRELLSRGCKVITCYSTNEEAAKSLKEDTLGKELSIIKCNISDKDDVNEMFEYVKKEYGYLDYLVNNAGINIDGFIKDYSVEDFKRVLDTNLVGKFLCTKSAYPLMSTGGSIVNITSHLGVTPCKESPAYCAAAAGIINLTKSTSLEFADKMIRVNAISPSFTPTPMSLAGWTEDEIAEKIAKTPLGRLNTPEDTAKLCAFLLSDEASFITGENIWINGGRL